MELQDSLPERRNLTVISLAFITYFYAGGQFTGEEIKLIVINAKFTKPWVLQLMVWLGFAYCIWRYMLTTKGQFRQKLAGELSDFCKTEFTSTYVLQRVPYRILNKQQEQGNFKNGYYWDGHCFSSGWGVKAIINYNELFEMENRNTPTSPEYEFQLYLQNNSPPPYTVKFNDISGWLFYAFILLKTTITKPSITLFLTPYFLAIIAVVGAFIN